MTKKTNAIQSEGIPNLINFFGKNFFSEPEIIDLKENSFSLNQTTLDGKEREEFAICL